mgnify:CR=1 FL=1
MTTYTGVADANGDFTVPFSSNYTGGQKVTVTAEKDSAIKSIELYAPSTPSDGGVIQFSGSLSDFPKNIGVVTLSGVTGIINNSCFLVSSASNIFAFATGLIVETGVTNIGDSAFEGWSNSKSLTLLNTVTSVGAGAFRWWNKATSLVLSSSLASIGASAFQGWSLLTTLDIPASVTNIGGAAFASLASLTKIIMHRATPPTISSNTFSALPAGCVIEVPAASLSAYKTAANWSGYASQMIGI